MQSLLTVNNNVSLLSVTIAPSTFIATLTLSLVFLALYLPPLRFRSGRSTSAPTAKYNYNPDYDTDYGYANANDHDTRDYAKSDGNRFAQYFNNTWWYPYWNRNRAPDPIELRDHPPLIEGLPQPRATLAIEDGRRHLGTGLRLAVRASSRISKTGGKERDRPATPDGATTRNAIQPARTPRRLFARIRIGQSLSAALRLPFGPQRLPEVGHRGGPERDGNFDGLRRWLQPAGLEAPRKR